MTREPCARLDIKVVICKPPIHTGTHIYSLGLYHIEKQSHRLENHCWLSKQPVALTVAVPFLRTKKKKSCMCNVIALYCESIVVACCAQSSLDSKLTATMKELKMHHTVGLVFGVSMPDSLCMDCSSRYVLNCSCIIKSHLLDCIGYL